MSKPIIHARNAVKKFGHPDFFDAYLAVHELFDTSKGLLADARHRAMFHHTRGIMLVENILKKEVTLPEDVTFRMLGQQHVMEDLNFMPEAREYLPGRHASFGFFLESYMTHARKDAERWGGRLEDYIPVHELIDFAPWFTTHNAYGPFMAQRRFGHTITNADGKHICVRDIVEDHIKRECAGKIPSFQDLVADVKIEAWMTGAKTVKYEIVD